MNLVRRGVLLSILQGVALFAWSADGGSGEAVEHQIKATYLYKFLTYVEWPSSAPVQAGKPFVIGVVGADEIASELNSLIGAHPMNDRMLVVKILKPTEPVSGVQILFIGGQEAEHLKHLLDSVRSQPVLTVTESAGALDTGSIINFVPVDDRIRFEVSLAQADKSGLKISSRLLGVAQKIETRRQ